VVEQRFPLAHRHGPAALGDALACRGGAWTLLCRGDPRLASMDLRTALFLDTETTGLAGGTGTHVFLAGVGAFDGEAFVVRQFFLRDYDEEPAMLLALHDLLCAGNAFVTFNGKMFDLPLLQTRYIAARLRRPFPDHAHLDLLHPARRLWKAQLPDCRLTTLDRAILRLPRHDDLPGWQVPALYVDYLRSGRAEPLRAVLAHNLHDILSLVALAYRMGSLAADPLAERAGDGRELIGLARLLAAAGRPAEARLVTARALRTPLDAAARREALLAHARYCKAAGFPEEALSAWESLAGSASLEGVFACIELAKHHEHRRRDRAMACTYTQRALAVAPRCAPRLVPALSHRAARLRVAPAARCSNIQGTPAGSRPG
jgi:uncharacterized protein YprB with RNaseH-like and TPR domain